MSSKCRPISNCGILVRSVFGQRPLRFCLAALGACLLSAITPSVWAEPFVSTNLVNTVAAVRQLKDEQVRQGISVRLRGVVTFVEPQAFYLDDGTDAIYVNNFEDSTSVKVCDLVELTGKTREGAFASDVILEHLQVLGQGVLPAAKEVSFTELDSGAVDCRLVQVQGVVRAQWQFPSLHQGYLKLLVERFPVEVGLVLKENDTFNFDVGTKVRVVGVACGRRNQARQQISARIQVRPEDIEAIQLSPSNPFDRPLKPAASLFRSGQKSTPEEMVRIEGVVVHQVLREWLFVRDESCSLRISTSTRDLLKPGTHVEAVGFAGRVGSVSVLEDAKVRVVGQAKAILPRPVTVRQVFTEHLEAELVTVDATLRGSTVAGKDWTLLCQQGENFFRARWNNESGLGPAAGGPGASEKLLAQVPWQVGSRLRLSGVVMLNGEVAAGAVSAPADFLLLIRSPQEIQLLAAPPWWDARKLVILVGLLALAIGGAVFWVWELRREVRFKSKAYAAVLAREEQLRERQRIGRELHDTFAQGLTGLGYELMAMARALETPSRVKQHLERALDLLERTREESRRGILNIRAAEIETMDFPKFLADSLTLLLQNSPLEMDFKSSGTLQPLPVPVQSNLIRIAQEATVNTLRHAQASKLRVELVFDSSGLGLTVVDDGIGFDLEKTSAQKLGRFGLCSMRERAEQIGATYCLKSEPGHGTRVSLWISVKGRTHELPLKRGGNGQAPRLPPEASSNRT